MIYVIFTSNVFCNKSTYNLVLEIVIDNVHLQYVRTFDNLLVLGSGVRLDLAVF